MKAIACKDVGVMDCPFVAMGETEDEAMMKLKEHGASAHGMSDAEMSSAENMAKMQASMKDM